MRRHRISRLFVASLLCFASLPARGESTSTSDEGLGDYVRFPACGIMIRQPAGFDKAESFDGFGQPETQSSIMAVSIPGPYSEIVAAFTKDHMSERGWTLRSKEDVEIDGLRGVLVHFEQPHAGKVFMKWSLALGDDHRTTMVTATVPKSASQELLNLMRAAVLSTRMDSSPPDDPEDVLSFTLTTPQKLKPASGITRTFTYTKDGSLPIKSPSDPFFIAAQALWEIAVGGKLKFAEGRLYQTANTRGLSIKSTEAVNIDGLDGYESLAEAEKANSGTAVVVYQVMLFKEDSYFLMQGFVGTELRDEYLPEFKAMARSFRRIGPGTAP